MSIQGEGMPVHNVPSLRGNMEITFSVQFPHSLSAAQKTGTKTLNGLLSHFASVCWNGFVLHLADKCLTTAAAIGDLFGIPHSPHAEVCGATMQVLWLSRVFKTDSQTLLSS